MRLPWREFKYPPTVTVLQALVKAPLIDNQNNLSKAVRLWYTLSQFRSGEFELEEFSERQWRKHLYKESFESNQDKTPNSIDSCISSYSIQDILFDRELDQDKRWSEWKLSFVDFYRVRGIRNLPPEDLQKYLTSLDSERPFYVTGKTIPNDLKALAKIPGDSEHKYLIYLEKDKLFKLPNEFPILVVAEFSQTKREQNSSEQESAISFQDPSYLLGDFSSFAYMFSEPLNGIQRFYIHADYHIPFTEQLQIPQYQKKLREIWTNQRSVPCELVYRSASQNRQYSAIVYPVCIYYYQRSFYLCAIGCNDLDRELTWHNYRFDRIQALTCLDWDLDRAVIPDLLVAKCDRANDNELITEVKSGLDDAYGFDFYQPKQLMVLRFNRDFHDRYIKNTFRHATFKSISKSEVNKLIQTEHLNHSDQSLIETRIKTHPQDAYYTMNYRVKDNSVIMRLRAWCPNVEVLYPLDLRQRMRDDMQKTWELYREDK